MRILLKTVELKRAKRSQSLHGGFPTHLWRCSLGARCSRQTKERAHSLQFPRYEYPFYADLIYNFEQCANDPKTTYPQLENWPDKWVTIISDYSPLQPSFSDHCGIHTMLNAFFFTRGHLRPTDISAYIPRFREILTQCIVARTCDPLYDYFLEHFENVNILQHIVNTRATLRLLNSFIAECSILCCTMSICSSIELLLSIFFRQEYGVFDLPMCFVVFDILDVFI